MERSVDSHNWASKIEIQRLFAGKPDLRIKVDARATGDEPTMAVKTGRIKRYRLFFAGKHRV